MANHVREARSVTELVTALRHGERPEYLYFWGHRPRADGALGPACLSQWWPAGIQVRGAHYPSAQHWMLAMKARLSGDHETAERIRLSPEPKDAQALDQEAGGFDDQEWHKHRLGTVVEGNLAKFGQHRELGQYLLDTGARVLAEASPVDEVWGIGLARDDEDASAPEHWPGQNLLGFALMEVRERLRGIPYANGQNGNGQRQRARRR
jgi:ribA/ribD-fused uncharacterized protein